MKSGMSRQLKTLASIVLSCHLASTAAKCQLNENCTVSILNRNVRANHDGSWVLPAISAGFGPVRARAACVESGVTTLGEFDSFSVAPNSTTDIPPIALGPNTPIQRA